MHLRNQLMRNHYSRNVPSLIQLITSDDNYFDSLIEMTVHESATLAARASWIMSLVCEQQPERFKPHLKTIIHLLGQPALTIPVKRHILRTLQFVDIPKRYHARLIDYCFNLLQHAQEPIAVKVFAMTVLANITADVPELRNELIIVLEDQLPYASAGFRSRASKILKLFNA
jgi:hypothetical protein